MKENQVELLQTKGIEGGISKAAFADGNVFVETNSIICAVFSCTSIGAGRGLFHLFNAGKLKYDKIKNGNKI